eukprot:6214136-Pleurochrysis_carterae.AAC.3
MRTQPLAISQSRKCMCVRACVRACACACACAVCACRVGVCTRALRQEASPAHRARASIERASTWSRPTPALGFERDAHAKDKV